MTHPLRAAVMISLLLPALEAVGDAMCHGEDGEATALRLARGKRRLNLKTLPG